MIYIDLSTLPFRPLSEAELPQATVLALGNFDGVHMGHRRLLQCVVDKARALSESTPTTPGVWLFRDAPNDFLRSPPTPHISTLNDKLLLFRECGIKIAFLGDFKHLAGCSPSDFIHSILKQQCRCVHAVCGFNYSFGKRGEGTPEMLREGFDGHMTEIPPVIIDGDYVSSTRIRNLISEGRVEEAERLLCRPYHFTSAVLHGKALGRTISFPTVNQDFPHLALIPKKGIYAVRISAPEGSLPTLYGVANVGTRPTVEKSDHINCETYILDFSGNLYGKKLCVEFIARIRDERKMDNLDELKQAISEDAQTARRIFKEKNFPM